jgi:site-specific DNA recombinase
MQDRLLNAYLAGTVDENIYKAKSSELKIETSRADESLAKVAVSGPDCGPRALSLYDWSQNAAGIWQGSNTA